MAVGALDRERPDLAAGFPELEGAGLSGYRLKLNTLKPVRRFRARPAGQTRGWHAAAAGARARPPTPPPCCGGGGDPAADGEHDRPQRLDPPGHAAQLAPGRRSPSPRSSRMPASPPTGRTCSRTSPIRLAYLAPFDPSDLDTPRWWLDGGRDLGDEELERWLGSEAIDSLCGLCQGQIEAFYRHLAGTGAPRYFVEKYLPHQVVPDLLAELYPGAREVILVRDFRDMLCSVIAFNRKRGWDAFGRSEGGDDAEYVRTTLRQSGAAARQTAAQGWWRHAARSLRGPGLEPGADPGRALRQVGDGRRSRGRAGDDPPHAGEHGGDGAPPHYLRPGRLDRPLARRLPEEIAAVCTEVLGPVLPSSATSRRSWRGGLTAAVVRGGRRCPRPAAGIRAATPGRCSTTCSASARSATTSSSSIG